MKREYTEEWYSLAAQIIVGQQKELEGVMLEQMGEWSGKEIGSIDDLTVGEIIGWLIDNLQAIEDASLIK